MALPRAVTSGRETVRRLVQARRRDREHLAARLGHAHRVLELGRQLAVARHGGPAVGEDLHVRLAEVDHRLDGEQHAGLEHDAVAGLAVVQDVGPVVEHAAEAVAAKIAHDAAALALGEVLDGGADMAGGVAGLHRRHAAHQRLVGHLDQPLGPARDVADRIHAAGIAMPAVEDQRHVDIDDVALLQRLGVGNAVADDVIDRRADGLGEAAIVERRGDGAVLDGEVERPARRAARS